MTPRPDLMAIPHSVILPLANEREVFAFQISSFDAFTLDFDLFPTFGSRAVGKAVALPSLFANLQNQGAYVLPLLDRHLKTIGEIAFELSVVRAFEGAKLDLGGGVETYWKATANPLAIANSGSQQPATPAAIDIPALMSSAADAAAIAGPTLVTASSLTGQYIRIIVQVTRDGVPVAYPLWKLPIDDLEVHVGDVTVEQVLALARRTSRSFDAAASYSEDPMSWYTAISHMLVPLSELLEALPPALGVNIDVRYPTLSDVRRLNLQHTLEVNAVVDAVLTTVYAGTNAASAPVKHRRIVFSSFNPVVCTALNWKQPNCAFSPSSCDVAEALMDAQTPSSLVRTAVCRGRVPATSCCRPIESRWIEDVRRYERRSNLQRRTTCWASSLMRPCWCVLFRYHRCLTSCSSPHSFTYRRSLAASKHIRSC